MNECSSFMTVIDVRRQQDIEKGTIYEVVLSDDDGSSTTHRVTVTETDRAALGGTAAPAEELVRHALRFLLARETKESILREFELMTIARYFPEYPDAMKDL